MSEWPEARVEAVHEATRDPSVKLWATDGTADWLLWRVPDLRGRIAYDIRFELYDRRSLDRIVDHGTRTGGWQRDLGARRRAGRPRRGAATTGSPSDGAS